MTKYEIKFSKKFKKGFKKLDADSQDSVLKVLALLADDIALAPKHKNHKLKGEYEGYEECHIKPDLLLIYEKQEEILVLLCIAIGSHSDLF